MTGVAVLRLPLADAEVLSAEISRREPEHLNGLLAKATPGDFYERLGRWFVADPNDRLATPF